jgi:tryptophanyl-tRNA synthetase
MKRVLSGLQPSGQLHLGNYVGAIQQFLKLQDSHEMFVFVASYHALTSTRDPQQLRANIRQVVVDYLAFGLDPSRCRIYLQQDVPGVCELSWMLACVCAKGMMDKATTFKDKVAKGLPASIGLYTYPILQAADILGVDADIVPVGEDQRQHVEITRDLAEKFNAQFGPTFKLPDILVRPDAGVIPGIDGQKMSKSYGNDIDPFMPEKPLRKRVMKIVTDSTPVEEPKNPERCSVFEIYRALAGKDDPRTAALDQRYRAGGMGYGDAKQALYELILDHFADARRRREELMKDPGHIDRVLRQGAESARAAMDPIVERARKAAGLG